MKQWRGNGQRTKSRRVETVLLVEINASARRTQLILFRWLNIPASLLQWCILTELLPAEDGKSKMNIYELANCIDFNLRINILLKWLNKTNRNEHVNASLAPMMKCGVGMQLVLRTIDSICIPHHLMSAITISAALLLRSRLKVWFTRSKKQNQFQSLEKISESTRRRR